ncbi:MAG: cytochrome b/b6 domain-containing protein [Paracoccaceae bacterium]
MTLFVNTNPSRVRVWDVAVRLFHWSLVAMVASAYVFDAPRSLHRSLGYVVIGLIAFRILWGFFGTRHARFSDFVPTPGKLLRYLADIWRSRERRYLGHNPAGGAMVIALLTALASVGATGYMMGMDAYFGAQWVEDAHKTLVNFLVLLVALHVGGVVFSSLRHRENLVLSMMTGEKNADHGDEDF